MTWFASDWWGGPPGPQPTPSSASCCCPGYCASSRKGRRGRPPPTRGAAPQWIHYASLFFLAATLSAQTLTGVIDIHAHSDPDSVPRSIDAIDAAKLARTRGIRGLVLKNHYEPTASLAYLVRKEVPGIELFGGIALNLTVGGVNPAAVERMTRVKGGWGRVVWMPTFDAENQVRFSKESRPFVPVSKNGRLLPEVKGVLALIEIGRASCRERV